MNIKTNVEVRRKHEEKKAREKQAQEKAMPKAVAPVKQTPIPHAKTTRRAVNDVVGSYENYLNHLNGGGGFAATGHSAIDRLLM